MEYSVSEMAKLLNLTVANVAYRLNKLGLKAPHTEDHLKVVQNYLVKDKKLTLELKQYNKETLADDKLTDVLAYTVLDENRISLALIPYKKLLKQLPTLSNKYEHRVSNNGSGEYIKVPVNRIKGAMTLERLYY